MERPEYVCGPPASRQTSSVTKYLNPAADTLWWASSTRGFAFNLGSPITLSMRSSTTAAMLYTPRAYRRGLASLDPAYFLLPSPLALAGANPFHLEPC